MQVLLTAVHQERKRLSMCSEIQSLWWGLGLQALRGRWSSVMPSDLFRPGALQRTSVPASAVAAGRRGKDFAPKYSNHAQSKLLQLALEKCVASPCSHLLDPCICLAVRRSSVYVWCPHFAMVLSCLRQAASTILPGMLGVHLHDVLEHCSHEAMAHSL